MIDDNNKDPTFVYKVPDTVYKVPTPQAHAAQMLGMPPELGYGLNGETFIDLIEDAFNFRQVLDAYADRRRAEILEEQRSRQPAPLGATGDQLGNYSNPYDSFSRNFRETEDRMSRSVWAPLANNY